MTKKRKINIFIPVAIVAGIGLAIYSSSKPFKVYQEEKGKAERMRTELNTLQKGNTKLREKDQLMNPVQKEEEARRLGYVRPGEVALPEKSNGTPATEPAAPATKTKKANSAEAPIDLRDSDKNDEIKAEPQ
jgi:hypothetical protein